MNISKTESILNRIRDCMSTFHFFNNIVVDNLKLGVPPEIVKERLNEQVNKIAWYEPEKRILSDYDIYKELMMVNQGDNSDQFLQFLVSKINIPSDLVDLASPNECEDRYRKAIVCLAEDGVIKHNDARTINGVLHRLASEITLWLDVIQECILTTKKNTSDAPKLTYNHDSPRSPKERILKNEKAVAMLKKLVEAGFCDSNYIWIKEGHNNYQKGVAAHEIGVLALDNYNYFPCFEDLWSCKDLSSDKYRATKLKRPESIAKVNEVKRALGLN